MKKVRGAAAKGHSAGPPCTGPGLASEPIHPTAGEPTEGQPAVHVGEWSSAWSAGRQRPYYYNQRTRQSVWQRPANFPGPAPNKQQHVSDGGATHPAAPDTVDTGPARAPEPQCREEGGGRGATDVSDGVRTEAAEPEAAAEALLPEPAPEMPPPVVLVPDPEPAVDHAAQMEERQQAAVEAWRARGAAAAALDQARHSVEKSVSLLVERWLTDETDVVGKKDDRRHKHSSKHKSKGGKPKGLRRMLATLSSVWPAASVADFPPAIGTDAKLYDTDRVKKLYLKAVRLVHPDKLGAAAPEQAATAALLFSHLSDANEAFRKKHAHRDR